MGRVRRNSDAVVRSFDAAFLAELEKAGVTPSGVVSYHNGTAEFVIETRAGSYTFHLVPQIPTDSGPLNFVGVFGRFAEPARAAKLVDCNPFSGKWNFNGLGYIPTAEAARQRAVTIAQRILALRN